MKLIILSVFALIAAAYASKRCIIPCPRHYKPLCGSDGKTYANECSMRVAACEKNEAIVAVRIGKCPDDDGKRCITWMIRTIRMIMMKRMMRMMRTMRMTM